MDHDRLFKELLGTFFLDFIRLFVPELALAIESASLVPLDKEVFTDVTAGERHEVDLLVQAKLKAQASYFLIHVETQSSAQSQFARRMFSYFSRLHERYGQPVYPIALFTYERPRSEAPDHYELEVAGLEVLRFRFRTVQLNQLKWQDFRDSDNPLASALMARMNVAPEDRARVKWECYRLLATLKLDPARTQLIVGFIESYLKLNEQEQAAFNAEAASAPPEQRRMVMEWVSPWQQMGLEEGRKVGLQEGRQEGRQEGLKEGLKEGRASGRRDEATHLVERLLNRRLNGVSPALLDEVRALSLEQLEDLAEAVFEIASEADLSRWLANR